MRRGAGAKQRRGAGAKQRRGAGPVRLERVLVPVDGSAAAQAAARLAVGLAKAQRGQLHACYVLDRAQMQTGATVPYLRDHVRTEIEREGRRALGRVEALCRAAGVPYAETLAEGPVASEIVAAARRVRADVIVMGTQGFGRLKAFLLGSTAQDLMSQAPCPVLVVRQGLRPRRRPREPRGRRA